MNELLNKIGAAYRPIYWGEPFGYTDYFKHWMYKEPKDGIANGLYVLLLNFSR